MKIPKATKLPSGSWNVKVMIDGRRISVTAPTKKAAEQEAAALKSGAKAAQKPDRITVGGAIDRYIASKDAVLSPTTIAGYKKMRKYVLQDIMDTPCSDLTTEQLQRSINRMAKEKSPKYVRNAYALFTATMAEYYPNRFFRITLPQKVPAKITIPTMEQIQLLHDDCKGKPFELPFLLAVWLGLRTSEIRGLTWDCIDGDTLLIKQAKVYGENGAVLKTTKTYSGNRALRIPPYIRTILDRMPRDGEYICPLGQNSLYDFLQRACDRVGIPRFRFHDLRHVNASVMLELNVPDKYAMERMGHATTNMLKTVYQHTVQEKKIQVANAVDSYFEEKLHTELPMK